MDKIQNFLFINGEHISHSWMKGEISYKDINALMAQKFSCSFEYLNDMLFQSIREMKLNMDLINIYQKYRAKNIPVVIMTDNMDIFSEFSVEHFQLHEYFDKIYNSAEIQQLKKDKKWALARQIAQEFNVANENTLVVDDRQELIDNLKSLGFNTYLYNLNTMDNFENYLNEFNV